MKPLPYIHDSITVTESMCDHDSHMNVNHYYKRFDSTSTSFYINELGFDEDYIKSGFSTFTLEDSIRYLNEFTLDEKVYPSFILYKANKKLLHFIGILQNEDAELAAIFETVLGHIDLQKRKIVNFSDDKIQHTQDICQKQKEGTDISFEIKLAIKDINE